MPNNPPSHLAACVLLQFTVILCVYCTHGRQGGGECVTMDRGECVTMDGGECVTMDRGECVTMDGGECYNGWRRVCYNGWRRVLQWMEESVLQWVEESLLYFAIMVILIGIEGLMTSVKLDVYDTKHSPYSTTSLSVLSQALLRMILYTALSLQKYIQYIIINKTTINTDKVYECTYT